jgi:hypothetical protein
VSRFAWSRSHIVTCHRFVGRLSRSAAKAPYRHCWVTRGAACASQDGCQSAVALGLSLGSLAHRAGPWIDRCRCSTATAKLHNAPLHEVPGQSVASFLCVPAPLRALRVYAAGVMQNCLRWSGRQSSALPGRFAPYAPPPVALGGALAAGF